jgi:CRISPR-associated endonuclease Csn1
MSKKILSLDFGITSMGYSILEEFENDRYSLVDYGVSMFDKPTDKDGNFKKLFHNTSASTIKLYDLRKQRKLHLA